LGDITKKKYYKNIKYKRKDKNNKKYYKRSSNKRFDNYTETDRRKINKIL
jgi:hypothetical protein